MIQINPKPQTSRVLHRQALMTALMPIRQSLHRHVQQIQANKNPNEAQAPDAIATPTSIPDNNGHHQSALDFICQTFQLSSFERDILLLCAGVELDATMRQLCAQAEPEYKHGSPTFNLAGQVLEQPHWDAFVPASPLRRWRLIEVGASRLLMTAPLRIDERVLHALLGVSYTDERLMSMIKPVEVSQVAVASHQGHVQTIVASWWKTLPQHSQPVLQLCGTEQDSKRAIASAACQQLGLSLYALSSNALPPNTSDLYQFLSLWEREAQLNHSALLLEWDDTHELDAARENAIALLIESVASPLLISCRSRRSLPQRSVITLDIHTPTSVEQRHLWHSALSPQVNSLNGYVDQLVSQFNLSPSAIASAGVQVNGYEALSKQTAEAEAERDVRQLIWQACRIQSRPELDDLAQRIESKEGWQDLVLPEQQKQTLQEIAAHVQQRAQVYENWGFAGRSNRGLGISALSSGGSGTGKTMAAGAIAQTLQLDLYRIDLSSVVSKYIGETEKNLRRVFDAAEKGGVILLFDEADALFGKRSDVKDSHDRYANMEVSYLLQRMEAYRGLAILTTNLKEAVDPAFLRRIRFVVRFPFPEYCDRITIWQRIFPTQTPTDNLDFKKLAKLNLAGGNIRNIALNATFLAAGQRCSAVTMEHLLQATQSEYLKLERQLTEAEIRGWL